MKAVTQLEKWNSLTNPHQKLGSKIYSSEDAYKVLLPTYNEGTICYKEYFKVLFLNQANQVLGYTLISEGGITDTTVESE